MLESRHLVGLFMLLVVIFGVVFTLGYLLGRSQYDGQLRAAVGKINDAAEAAASPAKPTIPSAAKSGSPAAVPSSDLDFYHTADNDKPDDHLQPKTQTAAANSPAPLAEPPKPSEPKSVERVTAVASKGPSLNAPLIPKGAIMLQVAALQREGDALALAQAFNRPNFRRSSSIPAPTNSTACRSGRTRTTRPPPKRGPVSKPRDSNPSSSAEPDASNMAMAANSSAPRTAWRFTIAAA